MSESTKERKPMSKKKKIILIVAASLLLLLILNLAFKPFWVRYEDGRLKLIFRYPPKAPYGLDDNEELYPTANSVSEMKWRLLTGAFTRDALYLLESGLSENATMPIHDLFKLGDFQFPNNQKVTRVMIARNALLLRSGEENAKDYISITLFTTSSGELNEFGGSPYSSWNFSSHSWDSERGVDVYYRERESSEYPDLPEKLVRYKVEDGEQSFAVQEMYDCRTDEKPYQVLLNYFNSEYKISARIVANVNDIPTEKWITSFRYVPVSQQEAAFWEKVLS